MNKLAVIMLGIVAICLVITSSWAETNIRINDQAMTYEGQTGWTCKEFIQYVISQIDGNLGSGYRDCYLKSGFEEVSQPEPGDVIQTSNPLINHIWDDRDLNGDGKVDYPYHTAFCDGSIEGSPRDYVVIDANRVPPWGKTVARGRWNPYSYVANKPGHQVYFYRLVVGRNANSSICKEVLQRYHKSGGSSVLGQPCSVNGNSAYVHTWYPHNFLCQNFSGGSWGDSVIVTKPDWQVAHSLHGAFFWYFWYYNVSNGLPISEEYHGKDGCAYQDFENGQSLKWDGQSVTTISTANLRQLGISSVEDGQVSIALASSQLILSGSAPSATTVQLSFNDVGASSYQVYQNGQHHLDLTETSLKIAGLNPLTEYCFQVVAIGSSGQVLKESNLLTVTTPASTSSEVQVQGPIKVVLLSGPGYVQPGKQYTFSLGIRNDSDSAISQVTGLAYPYQAGDFRFANVTPDDCFPIQAPALIGRGQTQRIADLTVEITKTELNIQLQVEVEFLVQSINRSWARWSSFSVPVIDVADESGLAGYDVLPAVSYFFDDFSGVSLVPNWQPFAFRGQVTLTGGQCRMESNSMYSGIQLTAPGLEPLKDFTLSFDLAQLGCCSNMTTEILVRQSGSQWVMLWIKDKEKHWVCLQDSSGHESTTYADLAAGRYQLSAFGGQVTFTNAEGSGTPVGVELQTDVIDAGGLVIQTNEDIITLDNVEIKTQNEPAAELNALSVEAATPAVSPVDSAAPAPAASLAPFAFADHFDDDLLAAWQTSADQGSVSVSSGQLLMQNGVNYAKAKLAIPGADQLVDCTVTFWLDTHGSSSGNQTTEILVRHAGADYISVFIKDKERHPLVLYDTKGNSVQQNIGLVPGYYRISASGSQVVFANVEGLGTPVYLELNTSVTGPGTLSFWVNEETVSFDDITVTSP